MYVSATELDISGSEHEKKLNTAFKEMKTETSPDDYSYY